MTELKEINMISIEEIIVIELTDGTKIALDKSDRKQMKKVLEEYNE